MLVLKNAKKLQALFKALIWAIVPSFNIGALMILHYSLFAILGMQVLGAESGPHFDEVSNVFPSGNGANVGGHRAYLLSELAQTQQTGQANFKSFFGAMKLLFECSTGKDWKIVMYEVSDVAGDGFAFGYFFFHFFFSVYILMNLFVAVIIDTFDSSLRELPVTPENMIVFRNVWKAHCIRQREELKARGWQHSKMARAMDSFIVIGEVEQEDEEQCKERLQIKVEELQKKGNHGRWGSAEDVDRAQNLPGQIRAEISKTVVTLQGTKSSGTIVANANIEPEGKWFNVVRLLKDVGRFKGASEDVLRQQQLKKEVEAIEDSIYTADLQRARKLIDGLERHQDVLTRSLHRVVELWTILVRPTDRSLGVEGLGGELKERDLENWDSGTLCAHPTWEDDQLRRDHLAWPVWWAKFFENLKLRRVETHNLYLEKRQTWWGKLFHANQDKDEGSRVPCACLPQTGTGIRGPSPAATTGCCVDGFSSTPASA